MKPDAYQLFYFMSVPNEEVRQCFECISDHLLFLLTYCAYIIEVVADEFVVTAHEYINLKCPFSSRSCHFGRYFGHRRMHMLQCDQNYFEWKASTFQSKQLPLVVEIKQMKAMTKQNNFYVSCDSMTDVRFHIFLLISIYLLCDNCLYFPNDVTS